MIFQRISLETVKELVWKEPVPAPGARAMSHLSLSKRRKVM
jgi:hypothetical protein